MSPVEIYIDDKRAGEIGESGGQFVVKNADTMVGYQGDNTGAVTVAGPGIFINIRLEKLGEQVSSNVNISRGPIAEFFKKIKKTPSAKLTIKRI